MTHFLKSYLIFLLLVICCQSYSQSQTYDDYIYLKRYNISVNPTNTQFEYIDKIDGLGIIHKGAVLNILGNYSIEIADLINKTKKEGVDSIRIDSLDAYLYKGLEKKGAPKPKVFYMSQIFLSNDTVSIFAMQNANDTLVEADMIRIIETAKIGDVKGDIYYFKDFRFAKSCYLRPCMNCEETDGIILTNNGLQDNSSWHRSMLKVQIIDSLTSLIHYNTIKDHKDSTDFISVFKTIQGKQWFSKLNYINADQKKPMYEYTLFEHGRIYLAEFTGPNVVKFRNEEIEEFLSNFVVKYPSN